MVTTELGACEWFVWDLRRSNLLDRGQLDRVVGEFLQKHPRAEPQALADFLVAQGILTQFQADRLLQGKRQGKLTPEQAATLGLQVAEGLDVCQKESLIHGLIKPSNLMLGADQQMRILDYGIGCLLAETEGESLVDTMSTANSVASGLDCASPESIMDPTNLTPLGDQYSLGCILYFMLTGQCPFPDGSAAEKMMAHQFKEATPIG